MFAAGMDSVTTLAFSGQGTMAGLADGSRIVDVVMGFNWNWGDQPMER